MQSPHGDTRGEPSCWGGQQWLQCSTTVQCSAVQCRGQERNHRLDIIQNRSQKAEDDTSGCERSIQETSTEHNNNSVLEMRSKGQEVGTVTCFVSVHHLCCFFLVSRGWSEFLFVCELMNFLMLLSPLLFYSFNFLCILVTFDI